MMMTHTFSFAFSSPHHMMENSLVGGRAFLSIRETLAEVSLVIVRGRSPCLYLNHHFKRKFLYSSKKGGVAELRHTRFAANFSIVLCSWIISLWNCSRGSSGFMAFRNSPNGWRNLRPKPFAKLFPPLEPLCPPPEPVMSHASATFSLLLRTHCVCDPLSIHLFTHPTAVISIISYAITHFAIRDRISSNCGPTYSTLFRFRFDN